MKKILQKTYTWLVMLVAMFAMSTSAMAEVVPVTFQFGASNILVNGSAFTTGQWQMNLPMTLSDDVFNVQIKFSRTAYIDEWAGTIYISSNYRDTYTVEVPEPYTISRLEMLYNSSWGGTPFDGYQDNGSDAMYKDFNARSATASASQSRGFVVGVRVYVNNPSAPTPAPSFPVVGQAYQLKNVDHNQYLNIVSDGTTAARLGDDPEPIYFTWDGNKAQFTIEDEEGNYIGTSSTSWNVGSTTPEYWTVEDMNDGTFALKTGSASNTYLGFDDTMGSRTYYAAFRGKTASNHAKFYIEEYVVNNNVYTVNVIGPAEGGVVYNGHNYTDEVRSNVELTENDVLPIEVAGYDAEVTFDGTTFTVTYTALPTLAIGSSATDREGNYWTSFCYNKPVEFAEGITPCIVTGTDNGKLTIREFVVNTIPATETVDFTVVRGSNTFTAYDGKITIATEGWNLSIGGYSQSVQDDASITVTLDDAVNGIIKSVRGVSIYGDYMFFNFNGSWISDIPVNGKSVTVLINNESYMDRFVIELEESDPAPVIPANTAVLVKSSAPGAVTYNTRPAGNVDTSANILQASGETGFTASDDADNLYYKLTLNAESEAGSAGFYWGVDGGHSISVPAHKAYLRLPVAAASNRAAFLFGGDDTITAIEGINAEADNTPVYNLQGQRVNATKAGVYVKNGRKFIVK